jgi:hypothetical protein
MLAAVTAWRDAVADMIPEVPRGIEASKKITDQQVLDWIAADQAKTPAETRELIKYASFHTLHNAGVSALNLNHARWLVESVEHHGPLGSANRQSSRCERKGATMYRTSGLSGASAIA